MDKHTVTIDNEHLVALSDLILSQKKKIENAKHALIDSAYLMSGMSLSTNLSDDEKLQLKKAVNNLIDILQNF